MNKKIIPIVMICDRNFAMQTCVTLTSLWKNKAQSTFYDVYVMTTQDCSEIAKKQIKSMEKEDFPIHIIEKNVEEYQNVRQMAHVSRAGLYKFDICDTILQYDKILYMDGDMIVRQDLGELYDTELDDNYVACVVHSLGIITHEKKLNSGLLLLNAVKVREDGLRNVLFQTRLDLGDRNSMDQETFHIVMKEKEVHLPPKYNVMLDKIDYEKKYYSLKAYNDFYHTDYRSRQEIVDSAVIIHFTGALKPWQYSFARCAEEWYEYYQLAFGKKYDLPLMSRKDYLNQILKKDGSKGIYWFMKDKVLEWLGEHLEVFPDLSHGEWN